MGSRLKAAKREMLQRLKMTERCPPPVGAGDVKAEYSLRGTEFIFLTLNSEEAAERFAGAITEAIEAAATAEKAGITIPRCAKVAKRPSTCSTSSGYSSMELESVSSSVWEGGFCH